PIHQWNQWNQWNQSTDRPRHAKCIPNGVQLRRVNCAGIELEPPWNLVEPPWNRLGTLKNLLKSTMEPWNLFFKKSNQGN
ncbi:hypothetical protein LAW23_22345, partial [Escherichia coli]|nr:hypothetical protein [Escherichia coli]